MLWLGSAIAAVLNAFPRILIFDVADAVEVVFRAHGHLWMEMIDLLWSSAEFFLDGVCV